MNTKTILTLGLAAALCAGGFTTTYQLHAAQAGPVAGRLAALRARIAERLAITDQQKSQIKAVLAADKDGIAAVATRWHDARKELRETIRSSNTSENAVRGAAAKVAVVEADIAVERAKLYRQLNPLLTETQRSQLAEIEARVDDLLADAIGRIGERLGQ